MESLILILLYQFEWDMFLHYWYIILLDMIYYCTLALFSNVCFYLCLIGFNFLIISF